MKMTAVITALAVALACSTAALGQSRTSRVAAVASTDEARAAIKSFRSIEARTQSGMDYQEFGREVSDLAVAAAALDEALDARRDTKLRGLLGRALAPFQDAKDLWSACLRFASTECGYGFVVMSNNGGVASMISDLLAAYPSLKTTIDNGGAFSSDDPEGKRIFYRNVVRALWGIGQTRAKEFRMALQSGGR